MCLGVSIHDAARTGDLERIKELINVVPEMKNKIDERGMNPLHIAAANSRLDCVKWLAVSGVDLAEETPTGYTAMHLAAMNGHVNCMMVSLKRILYMLCVYNDLLSVFYSTVNLIYVYLCGGKIK